MELLYAAGIAVGLFVTTNIDDVFLLVGWFARGRPPGRHVVAGQYLGIGLLALTSILLGAALAALASGWIRYLGLVPLALGARGLASIARGHQEGEPEAPATQGILAVALVTVSSGADNVSVYTPVFATLGAGGLVVTGVVFAVMTGLWCLGACALVNHLGTARRCGVAAR